jgi:hypothetical protein
MSSEEMREELESFVNQGLEEGWYGWPLKGWPFGAGQHWLAYGEDSAIEIEFFGSMPEQPFLAGGRLNRLFRTHLHNMNRWS